jgi:hypothetical protein
MLCYSRPILRAAQPIRTISSPIPHRFRHLHNSPSFFSDPASLGKAGSNKTSQEPQSLRTPQEPDPTSATFVGKVDVGDNPEEGSPRGTAAKSWDQGNATQSEADVKADRDETNVGASPERVIKAQSEVKEAQRELQDKQGENDM